MKNENRSVTIYLKKSIVEAIDNHIKDLNSINLHSRMISRQDFFEKLVLNHQDLLPYIKNI